MEEISFEDFTRVEIRTGTILDATLNTKARQPAYTLTIDFGPLGIKTSSAQITKNYHPENLIGMQISAVVNFPVKRIAGIKSEVLVLGAYSEEKEVVLLTLTDSVEDGSLVG
ncbi:MAG: putative chaperone CsaA [Deltaproteobacteria bacterium]|jgi:tRNA-binding protein|nr:putative chaperone CsaA [Deltaproteobacteria bacterium]